MALKAMMMLLAGKKKLTNAFTLIEIVLVVVIMGIVLAVALPNFNNSQQRMALRHAADDIQSISRWAQAMATTQRVNYALQISEDHQRYRILKKTLGENEQEDYQPLQGRRGRFISLAQGISINPTKLLIEFHSNFTIDPVEVILESKHDRITLSSKVQRGAMVIINEQEQ